MGYVLNKGNSGNIVVGNSTITEIEKVLSKSNAIGKCSSGVVFIDLILAEDEDGANNTDNYPIVKELIRLDEHVDKASLADIDSIDIIRLVPCRDKVRLSAFDGGEILVHKNTVKKIVDHYEKLDVKNGLFVSANSKGIVIDMLAAEKTKAKPSDTKCGFYNKIIDFIEKDPGVTKTIPFDIMNSRPRYLHLNCN